MREDILSSQFFLNQDFNGKKMEKCGNIIKFMIYYNIDTILHTIWLAESSITVK
jgi:hypothetical protein